MSLNSRGEHDFCSAFVAMRAIALGEHAVS